MIEFLIIIVGLVLIGLFIAVLRLPSYRYVEELEDFCGITQLTVRQIRKRLQSFGYEINHSLQWWIETKHGFQKIGARRVVGDRQYHMRIFDTKVGRRIYCHYEWTPEAKPFEHYSGEGWEIACDEAEGVFAR